MTTSNQDWVVHPGTDVYGSDDKKIGEIEDIRDGHLVVRRGFLFTHDVQVPFSAIAGHTEDRIDLAVTSDQAKDETWDTAAGTAGTGTDVTASGHGYAANDDDTKGGSAFAGDTSAVTASGADNATSGTTTGTAGAGTATRTSRSDHDDAVDTDRDNIAYVHIPVIEEDLEATKHDVERGAARVSTTVTEREASLDVPITEERVHVERHPVDREAIDADFTGDSETIEVPVRGEDVDVQKRARVVEEVEIGKDAVQETRHVSDTVRRQDVDVDEHGVTSTDASTRTNRRDTSDTRRDG